MRLLAFVFLFLPNILFAQSYPDYERTTVNDFAGLIGTDAENALIKDLEDLKRSTGVELTIVTLSRQEMFAPEQSFEQFATGLFNHWGIGDAQSNDGVMILVMHQDRAMRIELGRGFGTEWNRAAARVIDRSFLPAFKEDRYEDGIVAGTADTIDTIITPFKNGDSAPESGDGPEIWWILGALLGGFGLFSFRDSFVRLRKCPQCGSRALTRNRKTLRSATKSSEGHGERITRCSNCDYRDVIPFTISRTRSSSSSFGGGSSSGGGASGRW